MTAGDRAVWRGGSTQRAAASGSEPTADDEHVASSVRPDDVTVNVVKPVARSAGENCSMTQLLNGTNWSIVLIRQLNMRSPG